MTCGEASSKNSTRQPSIAEMMYPAAQMHGPDLRQVFAVMLAQSMSSPSLVQRTLHLALDLDSSGWMKEKVLVKGDPFVMMPPGRMQDDVGRKHRRVQVFVAGKGHRNILCAGQSTSLTRSSL